jgi:hypothetical protein
MSGPPPIQNDYAQNPVLKSRLVQKMETPVLKSRLVRRRPVAKSRHASREITTRQSRNHDTPVAICRFTSREITTKSGKEKSGKEKSGGESPRTSLEIHTGKEICSALVKAAHKLDDRVNFGSNKKALADCIEEYSLPLAPLLKFVTERIAQIQSETNPQYRFSKFGEEILSALPEAVQAQEELKAADLQQEAVGRQIAADATKRNRDDLQKFVAEMDEEDEAAKRVAENPDALFGVAEVDRA